MSTACYRGSAVALTSTPPPPTKKKYLAYPKKYLPILSYPQKYQDSSATKKCQQRWAVWNASKLLVVFHKYDFYNIY